VDGEREIKEVGEQKEKNTSSLFIEASYHRHTTTGDAK
jgi:hypothetical protein